MGAAPKGHTPENNVLRRSAMSKNGPRWPQDFPICAHSDPTSRPMYAQYVKNHEHHHTCAQHARKAGAERARQGPKTPCAQHARIRGGGRAGQERAQDTMQQPGMPADAGAWGAGKAPRLHDMSQACPPRGGLAGQERAQTLCSEHARMMRGPGGQERPQTFTCVCDMDADQLCAQRR